MIGPFGELKTAEDMLKKYKPSEDLELDFMQLKALLAQERVLDYSRIEMFKTHKHDSIKAKDYLFREYMVRHQISKFALKLSKEVTDRITCEVPEEKSFVAMCIKNRKLYPKPVKKS